MNRIPLTTEESRLWVEWKLQPNIAAHNLNIQYRLNGVVNVEQLNFALSTVINLFDACKTYFIEENNVPYKVVLPAIDFHIDVLDLTKVTSIPYPQLEEIANQHRLVLLNQPFNFKNPPLFRCKLIKFSPNNYYLIFIIPHILCDTYSLNLFLNLVSRLYNKGEEEKLKIVREYQRGPTAHFRNNASGIVLDSLAAESYWKAKFDSAPCQVDFNTSKKLIAKKQSKRISLRLPVNLISALKALARSENTSLFNIVAAAISIFLYRYFGQEDISLCYSVNVRSRDKYANQSFGFFVNELGLRTQLSKELNFRAVLARVIQQRVMDRKYFHYPLIEALLAKLRVDNPSLKFPFSVQLMQTSFFRWKENALKGLITQFIDHAAYDEVREGLLF